MTQVTLLTAAAQHTLHKETVPNKADETRAGNTPVTPA